MIHENVLRDFSVLCIFILYKSDINVMKLLSLNSTITLGL